MLKYLDEYNKTTRHKIEDKKKNDSNYHQVGNFYLMTVWYTVMNE